MWYTRLALVALVVLASLGCGGSGGTRQPARGIYSTELQLPGGKRTRVVIDLTNANSKTGAVRLTDTGTPSSGKLTGTIVNNSVALSGTLPAPYGQTTLNGTLSGNRFEGAIVTEAFPSTPLSATMETASSPYLGWTKMQFQGPGSVSGSVPGYWVQAGNEQYVAYDSAYIPDPNNQELKDVFGVAIYAGGSQWFAMMNWTNSADGYEYRVVLLPGSNEIEVSVISNNQLITEGSGTYSLVPYNP